MQKGFPRINHNCVVILFGPDGAGKSTQVEFMMQYFTANGVRVRKAWIMSLHSLAFIVSYVLAQLLGLRSPEEFRAKYAYSKAFRSVWYFIELVSVLPLILIRVHIPMLLGYVVIAERFVVDSIVAAREQ
jgi:ABC-type branched-subunit amino acid transport system ATPase component